MAIENPPAKVTPPPAPDRNTQQGNEFSNAARTWSFALPSVGDYYEAVSDNVFNNANEAQGFAATASAQAVAAANSATASLGYANTSLTYRNEGATIRDQTASIKASIKPGLITNGDDFSVDTNAWSTIRAADECGSLPYKPIFDFNFAKDEYSEYVGLSAGTQHAPLLDLATFTRAGDATGVNLFGKVETVGTNQPRVVFENGQAKGILLEKSAQNLLNSPDDFSGASWNKVGSTVLPDSLEIGGFNMDKIVESADNSAHSINVNGGISVSVGEKYSSYFVVYPDERNILSISFDGAAWGGVAQKVEFNLANETFNIELGAHSAKIKRIGRLYYCQVTTQPASTAATVGYRFYLRDLSGNEVYQGDGTSGMYIAYAQLEQASASSSYTSSVRAADNFRKLLPSDFDSNGDWTLRAEFVPKEVGEGNFNTQFMSMFNSGDSNFRLNVMSNTSGRLYVDIFQGVFVDSVPTSIDLNDEPSIKIKLRKSGDLISVFVNSAIVGILNINGENFNVNRINIGRGHNSSLVSNSTFGRVSLYPDAIPDIICEALTGV